jgi:hypothetical protein
MSCVWFLVHELLLQRITLKLQPKQLVLNAVARLPPRFTPCLYDLVTYISQTLYH